MRLSGAGDSSKELSCRAKRVAWCGALFLCLIAANASAETPVHAQETGVGGAVRASTHGVGAIAAAPSMLAIRPRYDIDVGVRFGPENARTLQAAALDSRSGPIAMGLLFDWTRAKPADDTINLPGWRLPDQTIESRLDDTVLAVGISKGWKSGGATELGQPGASPVRRWGFGLSGVMRSASSTNQEAVRQYDLNTSLSSRLTPQWAMTLTGENLLPQSDRTAPLGVGTGIRWEPNAEVALAFDGLVDLTSNETVALSTWGGAEVWAGGRVPIRIGGHRDVAADLYGVNAGLGYGDENGSINYGFRLGLGHPSGEELVGYPMWHSLSVLFAF